jgi:hypothetical protein
MLTQHFLHPRLHAHAPNHSYTLTACESWLFAEVCDSAPRTELFYWRRRSTLPKAWMLRSLKAFAICRTSIRTSTDPSLILKTVPKASCG